MSQDTTRPSAWVIMRPVQGRIRRAMAWSAIASATLVTMKKEYWQTFD